ncbi:HNH endonuclease signature motif containing protein [Streptomyces sp. 1222.5]|uniref:HNH endonuclease signature motif containing protein n=1 Tax=Streptomyces sp. 1222.5 TaxID=1881026 RepID=UPI003EB8968B
MRTLNARQRRSKKRHLYLKQHGFCALCHTPHPASELILKHRVHRKAGGANTLANLRLICHPCNRHPAA